MDRTQRNESAAQNLNGVRVALLATDGFEQQELEDPKLALERAGAQTQVVAPRAGTIRGWHHTDWGREVKVDLTLDQASAERFDALVLPGGVMNPDRLRMDPKAVAFVRAFWDSGKPISAICHGPWTLIEAGIARGHRLTSWPSLRTDLTNAGATWTDESVVRDGNLVTSRKPDDLPDFDRVMIETFREAHAHL